MLQTVVEVAVEERFCYDPLWRIPTRLVYRATKGVPTPMQAGHANLWPSDEDCIQENPFMCPAPHKCCDRKAFERC